MTKTIQLTEAERVYLRERWQRRYASSSHWVDVINQAEAQILRGLASKILGEELLEEEEYRALPVDVWVGPHRGWTKALGLEEVHARVLSGERVYAVA